MRFNLIENVREVYNINFDKKKPQTFIFFKNIDTTLIRRSLKLSVYTIWMLVAII